jgi:DNA invertase Pin-like site-specific DNA recombinase
MSMTARTIGYLRVSTPEQSFEKNKADILHFANDRNLGRVEWVQEIASGGIAWKKRKIQEVILSLQVGDRIITSELSRLGRSTLEVLEILRAVRERRVDLYSVKERLELDGSIQSKILSTMLALFAELERDFISQRTREALKAKKTAGVRLGRPPGPGKSKLDPNRPEIVALIKNGATKRFIALRYGVTPANLHNWLRKNRITEKPVAMTEPTESDRDRHTEPL